MAGSERHGAPRPRAAFSLPLRATAATLIVLIGLGAFFWTRPGVRRGAAEGPGRLSPTAAAHLPVGLGPGRDDLLFAAKPADADRPAPGLRRRQHASLEINLYSRQAKELLLKKKYFRQNLPATDWLKVRNISDRIDWLNYEILQLRGDQFCGQVDRLQRIMERENILLKLRLLEREIAAGAYQEV